MASQAADRLGGGLGERPAVPHHAQAIITSGEDDLRGLVSECYSIGIIMVGIDLGGMGCVRGEEGGGKGCVRGGEGERGVREELCDCVRRGEGERGGGRGERGRGGEGERGEGRVV